METALYLLAAFALIFVINMVPAFMPASWMVMAFFYIQFDVPLLLLTLGGALCSGLGRIVLAKGSRWVKRNHMESKQQDLDDLGAFLDERRNAAGSTVFLYSLSPLPTNNLFIAAGMAEVNLAWVLTGFWCARAIADTFWVWTTDQVFATLGDVFGDTYTSWLGIGFQLLGVTSIALLYLLPWARWLRRFLARHRETETTRASVNPPVR